MRYRATRLPLVPGERCPAQRSNTSSHRAVRAFQQQRYTATGVRDCGRCGAKDVKVERNGGFMPGSRVSAWYYSAHNVPERNA